MRLGTVWSDMRLQLGGALRGAVASCCRCLPCCSYIRCSSPLASSPLFGSHKTRREKKYVKRSRNAPPCPLQTSFPWSRYTYNVWQDLAGGRQKVVRDEVEEVIILVPSNQMYQVGGGKREQK